VLADEEKCRERSAARLKGVETGRQWLGEDDGKVGEEDRSWERKEGGGGKAEVTVGGASLVVDERERERRVWEGTAREAQQQRRPALQESGSQM
jgi:hypothetical protein